MSFSKPALERRAKIVNPGNFNPLPSDGDSSKKLTRTAWVPARNACTWKLELLQLGDGLTRCIRDGDDQARWSIDSGEELPLSAAALSMNEPYIVLR